MWKFLVGVIVGTVVGMFVLALISGAPDPEEKDGDSNDED